MTTYVWLNADMLRLGTFADYAREWQQSHLGDCTDDLSTEIRTWSEAHQVEAKYLGTDLDHWIRYELTANGESIQVSLDGRH